MWPRLRSRPGADVFDTVEAVRAQLRAGEDSLAEFKEIRMGQRGVTAPHPEDLAGEIVAFANGDGGVLFLGVADDGTVIGLPPDAVSTVERWVVDVATNNCDPPIRPIVRKMLLTEGAQERLLLLVEIKKSIYVHRTRGGRYYTRVGSSKRDLTAAELARLFQQRGRMFVFDEQLVPAASEADLDGDLLTAFFGDLAVPREDIILNTRVVGIDEEGVRRPSVAGLLAFGRKPHQYLPSAYIEAAVYRGTALDSDELVHSARITGPVATQIDEAVAFVDRFMLRPARKPLGREEYPQYALRAVYEAIVNAVAHRDYSLTGAKIRLFLFADRLELYSPGGLPNTITLENMPYRVFTRNQLLVSFLSRMRSPAFGRIYLESRGEGVRRILEESERHSGRRPEYRLLGEELLLTIWAKPSPHDH